MIRIAFYLFVVGFVAIPANGTPAPAPRKLTKEEQTKADIAALEGTWKIVSYQADGVERSAEEVAKMTPVTFKGYDYSFADEHSGKIINIDPTASPKTIDYSYGQWAIYELDGDNFMDCISYKENDRPTKFVSKEGSGHILIKYKRVKEQQ
jgi:uncharacterized protein (TIGR03067 family)